MLFITSSLLCHDPSAATSFEMVFQSSPYWNENDVAEFRGPFPTLSEFTSCHWEKVSYFAAHASTIWAYCYHHGNDVTRLNCIQLYWGGDISSYYKNIYYALWVVGLGSTDLDIMVKVDPYRHRAWNHVCVVYSNLTSSSIFYFNGQLVDNKTYDSLPVVPGSEFVGEYAFTLGQDPDTMRGNFSWDQAFYGRISELNLWNETIDESRIKAMATGNYFEKGNVVSWRKENFEFGSVVVQDIQDERTFFNAMKKKYMIFPQKLLKEEAKHTCLIHGGSVATPNSDLETEEVQKILLKHSKTCSDTITFDVFSKPGCWLGLEKPESNWIRYHPDQNDSTNYSYNKWKDEFWKSNFKGMCSRIQTNGMWKAETKGSCDKIRICTICEFSDTPVFSVRGLCGKVSQLQWNYYPIINDSYQIDTYEGYKRHQNISLNGLEWKCDYNGEKFRISGVEYPIGRLEWEWIEKSCTKEEIKRNLTFSTCDIHRHFTCDSGTCIKVRKRCDNTIDCADGSDEYDCVEVDIPSTYDKLNPPKSENNDSLHVNVSIIIKNINQINTVKMMIDSSLDVTMEWTDSRLMFRNLPPKGGKKFIKSEISKKLWMPVNDLIYDNAIVGELVQGRNMKVALITNSNALPIDYNRPRAELRYEGSNTRIQIHKSIRIKTTCNFQFTKFPFDNHECSILMHIKDFNNTKVDLVNSSISYTGGPIVGQFDVVGLPYPYFLTTQHPQSCLPNTALKITMKLERRSVNGMTHIITPSLILWLCAILTLQYDVNDLTNRNRTSVTALLVLVTLFGSINNKSDFPKTSDFKHIDIWFVWYLLNIFLIICHHTAISKISTKSGNSIRSSNEHTSGFMYEDVDMALLEKGVRRKKIINRTINITLFSLTFLFNVFYFLLAQSLI